MPGRYVLTVVCILLAVVRICEQVHFKELLCPETAGAHRTAAQMPCSSSRHRLVKIDAAAACRTVCLMGCMNSVTRYGNLSSGG